LIAVNSNPTLSPVPLSLHVFYQMVLPPVNGFATSLLPPYTQASIGSCRSSMDTALRVTGNKTN
jgi:hypothetical protein